MTPDDLRALFQVCAADPTPAGVRDAALLAVLYGGGRRRSDVVALGVEDYDPEADSLTVRAGKGNKDRICYTAEGSQPKLLAWLALRGPATGALFCPIRKDGTLVVRGMSADAVRKLLRKRVKEAGVATFSPHDLRRTMISDLLDAGADLSARCSNSRVMPRCKPRRATIDGAKRLNVRPRSYCTSRKGKLPQQTDQVEVCQSCRRSVGWCRS